MIEVIPNWHPVFVHFTVALLTVSGVLYLISVLLKDWKHRNTALLVAEWNFWLGSLLTIATAVAGWYAYNTVDHDTASHVAMTIHRNWAIATVLTIAVVALVIWFSKKRGKNTVSGLFALPVIIMLGLLGTTAWHGGEVVYRYGLGVMSMPKSTGDGHDHEHGPGQGHGEKPANKTKPGSNHHSIDDEHDHGSQH